jgi:CheY-like chemotaxis protein
MTLRAFIVDDERSSRMILSKMLQKLKHDVIVVGEASDGSSALKMLERTPVDLIFLDLQMPGMSGVEFLESASLGTHTQVILVTADQAFALQAYEYGITDYLLKPYAQGRLNSAIERAIRRKEDTIDSVMRSTDSIIIRLLKFMYSRQMEVLRPIPYRQSLFGYHYPFLSTHFSFSREFEILNILEKMEEAGLLSSSFENSVYLCNQCHNSYLNIRETCQKCDSSNLHSEDIVHHFSCGYVGPISDFNDPNDVNSLKCPKCSKVLKHIGVDYDKPSAMYHCHNCGSKSQNPMLTSKCMNCTIEVPVENLVYKQFKSFQLTEQGRSAARSGVNITLESLTGTSDSGFSPSRGGIFERSVKKEILRKRQANFDCSVALMQLDQIHTIMEKIEVNAQDQLYDELQDIIYKDLDPLCEIELRKPDLVYMLLPEKNLPKTNDLLDKIGSRLSMLLRENYRNSTFRTRFVAEDLTANDSYSGLMDKLNQRIAEMRQIPTY